MQNIPIWQDFSTNFAYRFCTKYIVSLSCLQNVLSSLHTRSGTWLLHTHKSYADLLYPFHVTGLFLHPLKTFGFLIISGGTEVS